MNDIGMEMRVVDVGNGMVSPVQHFPGAVTDIPTLTGEAIKKHHENLADGLRDMLIEKQKLHDAEIALRQKNHEEFVADTEAYIRLVIENGRQSSDDITKQMRETAERVKAMEGKATVNGEGF